MREYRVSAINAPNRFLLIMAATPLEAEKFAARDGYVTFGVTLPVGEPADGNEFEGMTPRDLRNLCRSLRDDLARAVMDRAKLLNAVREIRSATDDSGPADTNDRVTVMRANRIASHIIAEVEGKK